MPNKHRPKVIARKKARPATESKFIGVSRDFKLFPKTARSPNNDTEKTIPTLRSGPQSPFVKNLIQLLDGCTKRNPCWSAACPVCGLAIERHMTAEFKRALKANRGRGTIAAITIVDPSGSVPVGKLKGFDIENFGRRLKKKLNGTGIGWMIGCYDICLNDHEANQYKPHWSVHIHGFTVTDDIEGLRQRFREVFQKTDAIPRPVKIKEWNGSKKAIRYALKTRFKRRTGVGNALRHNPKTGKSPKGRTTKTNCLPASAKRELIKYLHRIGAESRIFLRFAQLRGSRSGPTISVIRSAKAAASPKLAGRK